MKIKDIIESIWAYVKVGSIVAKYDRENDLVLDYAFSKPGKWRQYQHGEGGDRPSSFKIASTNILVFEPDDGGRKVVTWATDSLYSTGITRWYDDVHSPHTSTIDSFYIENTRSNRKYMVRLMNIRNKLTRTKTVFQVEIEGEFTV